MKEAKEEEELEVLHSLRTQQQRILEFQKSSYQWHLRHHENIKKVMWGLSKLLEYSGFEGPPLEMVEPDEHEQGIVKTPKKPKKPKKLSLNEKVQAALEDPKTLNDLFVSLDSPGDIQSLRPDYYSLALSSIPRWLESLSNPTLLKASLLYLWVGKDHFRSTMRKSIPLIGQILRIFEQKLRKDHVMLVDGVTLEGVQELYDELNKLANQR